MNTDGDKPLDTAEMFLQMMIEQFKKQLQTQLNLNIDDLNDKELRKSTYFLLSQALQDGVFRFALNEDGGVDAFLNSDPHNPERRLAVFERLKSRPPVVKY